MQVQEKRVWLKYTTCLLPSQLLDTSLPFRERISHPKAKVRTKPNTMDAINSFVGPNPGETVDSFVQRCPPYTPPSEPQLYQDWQHWLTVPAKGRQHARAQRMPCILQTYQFFLRLLRNSPQKLGLNSRPNVIKCYVWDYAFAWTCSLFSPTTIFSTDRHNYQMHR